MGLHGGVVSSHLTIAKKQRSACGLVCAGAGIMRLRVRGARAQVEGSPTLRQKYMGCSLHSGRCVQNKFAAELTTVT